MLNSTSSTGSLVVSELGITARRLPGATPEGSGAGEDATSRDMEETVASEEVENVAAFILRLNDTQVNKVFVHINRWFWQLLHKRRLRRQLLPLSSGLVGKLGVSIPSLLIFLSSFDSFSIISPQPCHPHPIRLVTSNIPWNLHACY